MPPTYTSPLPGITPACAGNSLLFGILEAQKKDHPRVCGEQGGGNGGHGAGKGSPPRVRGTAPGRRTTGPPPGITPACAGNSPRFRRCRWWPKDHPRVCGEQATLLVARISEAGSPPRVRGTDNDGIPRLQSHGITPACAGNSHPGHSGKASEEDHPRVCGEQASQ